MLPCVAGTGQMACPGRVGVILLWALGRLCVLLSFFLCTCVVYFNVPYKII